MAYIAKRAAALALIMGLILAALTSCTSAAPVLNPERRTEISLWHYFTGNQLDEFNRLVAQFNRTQGREKGIELEARAFGSAQALWSRLEEAMADDDGELPDIFMTDTDSAYSLAGDGIMADLGDYMSREEIDGYVLSFWQEGVLDGEPHIFPIQKSTDVMFVDSVSWRSFAAYAGFGSAEKTLSAWENIVEAAKSYHEFTDSLTEEEYDGKAMFSVSSAYNYIQVTLRQMEAQLIRVQNNRGFVEFNDEALRRMWENYYVPMALGYFADGGGAGAQAVGEGRIISYVGPATDCNDFPDAVLQGDGSSKRVQMTVLPAPVFEGGRKYTVQQGDGMVVTKSDIHSEYAAVTFLKWFTEPERNLDFAAVRGCLPVRKEAISGKLMQDMLTDMDEGDAASAKTAAAIRAQLQQINTYSIYYPIPYAGSVEMRKLFDGLRPIAVQARRDFLAALGEEGYEAAYEKVCGEEAFRSWLIGFKAEIETLLAAN